MDTALVIGGTQFVGRHAVSELLAHDYEVTLFNRGNHENPFAADERVDHVEGDRTDDDAVRRAAAAVTPDLVVDCVAYHPDEVRVAVEAFADVDAYVYVSSGSAYEFGHVPVREGETPLVPCETADETDDSVETYGARKAEGDRVVFEAAERGINAMSVRPYLVYGPHDYTERFDSWIAQVAAYDRVVVPGDGGSILHRAYVEDVASAIRTVAESGTPGEAYNAADHDLMTLDGSLSRVADALDTTVETVHASERELDAAGLSPTDFPLYTPMPSFASTEKLEALGWSSTPLDVSIARTVEDHLDSGRDGSDLSPDRDAVEELLARFDAGAA